ncbi:MAG: T9SS type A sorting domain-containing protein [Bacteroidales bacterium]|nr:T9SS type A sorting domain-containing protein [Bacteroidales bacterium]
MQKVYLGDKSLNVSQEKTGNNHEAFVFNTIESFTPPFGEITMLSGQQGVPNQSGKYTHDYTVEVGMEGYKPELVITPPAGSVLTYEAGEAVVTENPLVWKVRATVMSPPGQQVTEAPTLNFYAVPVGINENPEMKENFALGKIISTGYGTDINYKLKQATNIEAGVYSLNGQLVESLSSGKQQAGENKFHWDSYNEAAGIYTINIRPQGQKPITLKIVKR